MSIQAGINQNLSLAGLLFTQTEAYKTMGKVRGIKTIDKRLDVARKRGLQTIEQIQSVADLEKEKADLLYEKYKAKPSVKAHQAAEAQGEKAEEARRAVPTDVEIDPEHPEAGTYSVGEIEDEAARQEALANDNQPEDEKSPEMINFEETPDKNEIARQKADAALASEVKTIRETNSRKAGFTSTRYGTNKTRISFKGGNK